MITVIINFITSLIVSPWKWLIKWLVESEKNLCEVRNDLKEKTQELNTLIKIKKIHDKIEKEPIADNITDAINRLQQSDKND
jgi:hypothetical protein